MRHTPRTSPWFAACRVTLAVLILTCSLTLYRPPVAAAAGAESTGYRLPIIYVHGLHDSIDLWSDTSGSTAWTAAPGSGPIAGDREWALYRGSASPDAVGTEDMPLFDEKTPIYLFEHKQYAKGAGDINQNGANLSRAIDRVLAEETESQGRPVTQVFLVVHSMGGLISRSYLQYLSGVTTSDNVAGLCTLTTPHRGCISLVWPIGDEIDVLLAIKSRWISAVGDSFKWLFDPNREKFTEAWGHFWAAIDGEGVDQMSSFDIFGLELPEELTGLAPDYTGIEGAQDIIFYLNYLVSQGWKSEAEPYAKGGYLDVINNPENPLPDQVLYSAAVGNHFLYWGDGLLKAQEQLPNDRMMEPGQWAVRWVDAVHNGETGKAWYETASAALGKDVSQRTDTDIPVAESLEAQQFAARRYWDAQRRVGYPSDDGTTDEADVPEQDRRISAPISTVILVDTSGSMGDPLPSGQRKMDGAVDALLGLRSQLEVPGDSPPAFSLMSFDTGTNAVIPIGLLDEALIGPDGTYAREVSNFSGVVGSGTFGGGFGLFSGGLASGTNLRDGLDQAMEQLARTDSAGQSIVLLTDGVPTPGEGEQNSKASILRDSVSAAASKGIVIHTIGFGTPGKQNDAGILDYDPAFLKEIADKTGGTFQAAGAGGASKELGNAMAAALLESSGFDATADESGKVAKSKTFTDKIAVPKGSDVRVVVGATRGDVTVSLKDGEGQNASGMYRGRSVATAGTTQQTTVVEAVPGTWTVTLTPDPDVNKGSADFYVVAGTRPSLPAASRGDVPSHTIDASAVPLAVAVEPAEMKGPDYTKIGIGLLLAALLAAAVMLLTAPKPGPEGPEVAEEPGAAPNRRVGWLQLSDGSIIELVHGEPFTIGRSGNNKLVLGDPLVSGHHAIIEFAHGVAIVDQGSRNGTKVNGSPITRVSLTGGERIRIGDTELLYRAEGAPAV